MRGAEKSSPPPFRLPLLLYCLHRNHCVLPLRAAHTHMCACVLAYQQRHREEKRGGRLFCVFPPPFFGEE